MKPALLALSILTGCEFAPCLSDVPFNPCEGATPHAINVGEVADAVLHGSAFVTCADGVPTAITCYDRGWWRLTCHIMAGLGPRPEGLPMCGMFAQTDGRVLMPPPVADPVSVCDRRDECVAGICSPFVYATTYGPTIKCRDDSGDVDWVYDAARQCEWFGEGNLPECGDDLAPVYNLPAL